MSCCAFSQDILQTSIYGYRDTVVKAIFESGRKSKVETVYNVRKYPIRVSYLERTKYYRQNDSFVVQSSLWGGSYSDGRNYSATYYDSQFRLIGASTITDNKSYKKDEYMYDNAGRITRYVMYRDSNVITYLREYEYNDKERFFVERGYRYTKTYYDSLGEYTISYSASDSSKEWTDTVYHKTFGKLSIMLLTGQISIAPDPNASAIHTVTHEFDSENRPIKMSFLHENKHLIKTTNFIYAVNGKMAEENTVRANGDTINKIQYFYDERNNLIETRYRTERRSFIDTAGNITYSDHVATIYAYDKMNRLLIRQTGSGESASILSNKYDDRGDLIEYKYVDKGKLTRLSEYTYEY